MSDLPAKQEPDWELAKILYCEGRPRAEICKRAGCGMTALDRKVTRQKWVQLRERFNEEAAPQTMSIAQRGRLVEQLIATEAHAQLHNLTQIPNSKSVDSAFTKASTLAKLSDVSKDVFGGIGERRMLDFENMANSKPVPGGIDWSNIKDAEFVEHLGGGFTRLTKNGVSRIVDDRIPCLHDMTAKPPRLIDLPPIPARMLPTAENMAGSQGPDSLDSEQRPSEPVSTVESANETE